MLEKIISLIAPHSCLGCTAEGALLCRNCALQLPPIVPRCYHCAASTKDYRTCPACRRTSALFQVWAVTAYDGVAKALVRKLKYERARQGGRDMADCLVRLLPDNDWVVCHVPTATVRVRQRGYDQAQLMAKMIATRRGWPREVLLARFGQQRQVGQRRLTRHEQLKDVFVVRSLQQVKGKHVLLIDDVITTGATLEAAAQALKRAGARRVSAAVFAVA